MVSARVLAAVGLGLAASACGYSHHTTEVVRPVPAAIAYTSPAPVTTTYVTPVATTYVAPAPAVVYPPATTPPAGVQAFRDEYGYRYDGQGNRLDRYGNIISPYSTRP